MLSRRAGLLISAVSAASAQTYWSCGDWNYGDWNYGDYGLRARGYYGTPYDSGPQYGSGGGDQYGYSYAVRRLAETGAESHHRRDTRFE